MIEIRNTSQEPIVVKLSTYEATVQVDPGHVVEVDAYEPGIVIQFWPLYNANLPRKPASGVRPDVDAREG